MLKVCNFSFPSGVVSATLGLMKNHTSVLNRREFLYSTGMTALFGSLAINNQGASADNKRALVGSNIYGWSQYYQQKKQNVQDHLDELYAELKAAGYDYLESFMDVGNPEKNRIVADRMKDKGLKPVSIYTGARVHESGKAEENVRKILEAAKVCKAAGYEIISCNPDPIGREKTDAELKIQIEALTLLGKGLNDLGLKLGIHHHLPEMANKAREFHFVFRNTDPKIVGFCYDVHWIYKGGIAPMEVLKEYGNRVVTWHIRQGRNGIWWEDLDTGDVDYSVVADYARQHKLPQRYTVELALENGTKITRSAEENHRRSREFIRKVFGC